MLQKPIGYWVKLADNALTLRMNEMFSAHGITRIDWQILNIIGGESIASESYLLGTMRIHTDDETLHGAIGKLTGMGWASRAGNGYSLTEEGRKQFDAIGSTNRSFREMVAEGISPEDYQTAISVLQRIIANLETAG
ncbi:MAG: hypothetical protein JWQ98_336 [Chlorobi bacterium]|nr:hypothetical protein [Chlorobiota bacterium]